MHDGKALQSGTSHFFGDGFARAFGVSYQGRDGALHTPFQTSWGVSTRSIGGIIMTHGDDRGLKLPPRVAPIQVVIVPFAAHKEGVIEKANALEILLKENNIRVKNDIREEQTPGYKCNEWELKGVPVRLEIGPRDIENNKAILFRRDTFEKTEVSLDNIVEEINDLLEKIQKNMYDMALKNRESKTKIATNMDEYKSHFEKEDGFVKIMWCGKRECEDKLKEECSSTIRCIPFDEDKINDTCAICGEKAIHMVYTGKQY